MQNAQSPGSASAPRAGEVGVLQMASMLDAVLSAECVGWARAAQYAVLDGDEPGAVVLRHTDPAAGRYILRSRAEGRVELFASVDGEEESVLYAAGMAVMERYLVGVLADELREDLDLPYLELPWADARDLAAGYEITPLERGFRVLRRSGGGPPIAAARDETLSLVKLVPLSHFLGWSVAELTRSFRDPAGAPFLVGGRYATGPKAPPR